MSNKTVLKPLSAAVGAAFVTSLAGASIASAAENPFAMTELSGGYMVAESAEGKCGGAAKPAEGKCGEGMKTEAEGKTEAEDKTEAEGKCGSGKTKTEAEGKCGEGKCGAGN